jgi:murein L,D-transpeptidase YcbB/YkuD
MTVTRVQKSAYRLLACLAAACALAGCTSKDVAGQVAAAIQQAVTAAPAGANLAVSEDVQRFYAARSFAAAWTMDTEQAASAVRVLRQAAAHGLPANAYGGTDLSGLLAPAKKSIEESLDYDAGRLAQLDVRVTTALLALGRDVAVGRVGPASIDSRWKVRRSAPDLAGSLAQAAASGPLDSWLDRVRPLHPEYAALQKTLATLQSQVGGAAGNDEAARRISLNLERWRWMPDDLGARHVLVNVPAFYMAVREQGRPVVEMKVVVGTPERKTPLFSATMETVVFSPYWNVPDSIAEGETAPAAARDPRFLQRNHIDILRRDGDGMTLVDPDSVDWDDADALKALAFRQRPGAHNALGHVKFLFPNPYDVYLHDTPADALFARQGRAFSHGCVRVEKPEALASYLLGSSPEWDAQRIEAAMHRDEEQHVALKEKLPVYVVYFTAWPDGRGGARTFPDVYGYDAKQAGAVAKSRPSASAD